MLKSAGLFYIEGIGDMIFNKPALCVEEKINLLNSRRLNFKDVEFAKTILGNITYYRLSAYMKYFQDNDDRYYPQTTFEDIVNLYNFDKDLKLLIFENIRIIEVALRAKICLYQCSNYGSHWFYNKNNFKSEEDYQKTLDILNNEKVFLKDTFIKYYFKKYSSPDLPPFWMCSEVLSMGDLSKILSGIHFKDIKQISKNLTPTYFVAPVISNWVHVLATIRNICVDHSRLWNRKLKIKFSTPQKIDAWHNNNVTPDTVYAVCFVLAILLKNDPYNNFETSIIQLFEKYPNINIQDMGFPKNWHQFNF